VLLLQEQYVTQTETPNDYWDGETPTIYWNDAIKLSITLDLCKLAEEYQNALTDYRFYTFLDKISKLLT